MEEFLKRKTVNLFEKDQDALDDAFKKQSPDMAAPENLEKVEVNENDDGTFSKIGTGMTESSGVFSFASTGVYLINFTAAFTLNGSDRAIGIEIDTTTDGSSFDNAVATH